MSMIGFNLTRVLAERKKVHVANIRISNNVSIKNVEESTFSVDPKKSIVRISFEFSCKYEPEAGMISIEGEVLELQDKEMAKALTESWKNGKKLAPEFSTYVLNIVLARCNIEAILLSRELSLPSPIPLPKIEAKQAVNRKEPAKEASTETSKDEPLKEPSKEDKKKK